METQSTKGRRSLFILVTLLIIVVVPYARNIFQYPYYQDGEGTSIANGWALATQGQLSPYTFAYDQPPVGTFLLGLWISITGGLSTFGFSVNSGRVLMLILHLLTTAFLYGIAKKSSKSDRVAVVATLIFSFSPLSTILQRRVLLDNIMIVWLLLALYLVLGEKRTLAHYLSSALFFGLAGLTTGSALFFLPALIYTIRLRANGHHKRFAINLWITLFILLIAFYPLYAQMKQELVPRGWFLGSNLPHVSLLDRLADRGSDTGRFLNFASGLPQSFNLWVDTSNPEADPILIYVGLISTLFVILLSLDNRNLRPLVAMTLGYALYLLFGGQIFDSAAIGLLPFLSLNSAIVIVSFTKLVGKVSSQPVFHHALVGVITLVLLYPFWMFYSTRLGIYTLNQVDGQIAAVNWIKANALKDAVVITDNYAFVDLRNTFANAHNYWKVDTDPAIKLNVLDDNPCNIDYVVSTPQVLADVKTHNLDLMSKALDISRVLVSYSNNGWPVEIRQISKQNCVLKTDSETVATQLFSLGR